jgi:hypothetical protein
MDLVYLDNNATTPLAHGVLGDDAVSHRVGMAIHRACIGLGRGRGMRWMRGGHRWRADWVRITRLRLPVEDGGD